MMTRLVTLNKMLCELILLALFGGWLVSGSSTPKKPNILFIFMDDLDLDLGSMQYLPSVKDKIEDEGKCA